MVFKRVADAWRRCSRLSSCFLIPALAACGGSGGPEAAAPPTGELVSSFGVAGSIEDTPALVTTYASRVVADATHMYVGGITDELGNTAWRLEKRALVDGALDPVFGGGSEILSNPTGGADTLTALALDDTHLYVGGIVNAPADMAWRIERRSLVDGSLDAGFGVGGVVTVNPTAGVDALRALLIVGSRLFLAGTVGDAWRVECRFSVTGALVDSFGVLGVLDIDPSPGADATTSLATDGASLFVVGRDLSAGGTDHSIRVEKRSVINGSLQAGFGVGGVLTSNPSPTFDAAYDAVVSDGWLFLAGIDEQPGLNDRRLHLQKRSVVDGSRDLGFGVGGLVATDISTGRDEYLAVVASGGHVWLAGVDRRSGDRRWRLEKRSATTGALDASFGESGVVLFDTPGRDDQAEDLVVSGNRLIAVGLMSDDGWRIEARQP